MTIKNLTLLAAAATLCLAGCGGNSSSPAVAPVQPDQPAPPAQVYAGASPGTSDQLWNHCEISHSGPVQNQPGTQADEKGFIRAFTQATYLWNTEVPDVDPTTYPTVIDYFNALKTPQLTAAGHPKDRFHFTYPSDVFDALSDGVELGYGVTWLAGNDNKVPRVWHVALVEPGSPAALAGMQRGDYLTMVDGLDFINRSDTASVAQINAALAPAKEGEQHRFTVWRNKRELQFVLTAGQSTAAPVQNTRVIDTANGKLGYLTFNSHIAPAEKQLYDAFNTFKAAAVNDLVIDMRYNGGGLVSIASELAYMVAGPDASNGKVFVQFATNGHLQPGRPTLFQAKSLALPAPQSLAFGTPLPSLNLKHATVLTGPGTCSASEAVINGLRGIGVEVDTVGGQTCGKPYAFVPLANCGTTYFLVQYQSTNQQGWGDYADGFAPTCAADDDMSHVVGDPAEGLLAQAIALHNGQACAAPRVLRQAARQAAPATATAPDPAVIPTRPQVKEITILPPQKPI